MLAKFLLKTVPINVYLVAQLDVAGSWGALGRVLAVSRINPRNTSTNHQVDLQCQVHADNTVSNIP